MKHDFKREVIGETTRMILELESREGLDQFALNMMNHNRIEGLAPVELALYDRTYYLQYDVTGKDTLDNRLSRVLKKNEVLQILNSIIRAFEETRAYMLSENSLSLDLHYVFIDEQDRCTFLYLPFLQEQYEDGVSFLQKVVEHIQPNYGEKDSYLFHLLNAFGRGAVKKISDLKELIHKNSTDLLGANEKAPTPVRQEAAKETDEKAEVKEQIPEPAQPSLERVSNVAVPSALPFAIPGKDGNLPLNIPEPGKGSESKKAEKKKGREKEKSSKKISRKEEVPKSSDAKKQHEGRFFWKKGKAAETGEKGGQPFPERPQQDQSRADDMYESYEQTVMMQQAAPAVDPGATVCLNRSGPIGVLERKRGGEPMEIVRNGAVLGSGTGADCLITGNKAISRSHATISVREGVCYIMDNHSSNGTWVNGNRLVPGQAEELSAGSVIKLANEEFLFRR